MVDDAEESASTDGAPEELRGRLALALDVDDLVAAERLARDLSPWFGVAKVGLELYSAAGPDAVTAMVRLGYDVFCDLKLHDIPTTVQRTARVIGALGARYLTLHAVGGAPMLRAGVEGLAEGAAGAALSTPMALGVTVLTSEPEASHRALATRVAAAMAGGCGGLVCASPDLHEVRQLAPRMVLVVPGIRPAGTVANDQARVGTPADAFAAGADILVIGRAVTASPDPRAAAERLVAGLRQPAAAVPPI
ncbi:MAG: orotidine-5'-phosphate decarboxylase [Acidimicrobiales bacterium]